MRTADHSATDTRVALYVRVSSEEQIEGYSLDAQQRATTAYCTAHGWEVVREYRDEGKSAWTDDIAKRPAFSQMVRDAEAGHFDVVLVHKLDRFSRNLLTTLETLHRLEAAGVGFVSISESMNFTTPIGKVILATLGAFAEYYSANLSAETRKGKGERKQQGLYNGVLPFGTTKGADRVPVPHPENHQGLVLAFELSAAGKTDREVAQALTAAGYRTSGNRGSNVFTKDTVRVMLQNRFYLGELPDGKGGWMPGRHAAVLDAELFQRAQAARGRNTSRPRRVAGPRSPWALSGLARCAWCGAPMTAAGNRDGGRQRVQCQGRVQGKGCTAPTFYSAVLDEQLGTLLRGFTAEERSRTQLLEAWGRHARRDVDTSTIRAGLERKLARYQTLYLEGDLDLRTYRHQKAAIAGELAALPADEGNSQAAAMRLAGYLADLSSAWAVATSVERNRLARELFDEVLIDNRTAVAVRPRPDLRPFFSLLELPSDSSDAGLGDPGSASSSRRQVEDGLTQQRKRRDSVHPLHDASRSRCLRRGPQAPAHGIVGSGIVSSGPAASIVTGTGDRHPTASSDSVVALTCCRLRRES